MPPDCDSDVIQVQRGSAGGIPPFRLFHVAASGSLTLVDVTLSNGSATDQLPTDQDEDGGAVWNNGDLTLDGAINFAAAQTRAGNAIMGLAGDGSGHLAVLPTVAGAGTVHLIVDVTGYFE